MRADYRRVKRNFVPWWRANCDVDLSSWPAAAIGLLVASNQLGPLSRWLVWLVLVIGVSFIKREMGSIWSNSLICRFDWVGFALHFDAR